MEEGKFLPAGTLVMFGAGAYSDFRNLALTRLLKPIGESDWLMMCAACVPTQPSRYKEFDEDKALPWFIREGYVEEVSFAELWLGDYGRAPSWKYA